MRCCCGAGVFACWWVVALLTVFGLMVVACYIVVDLGAVVLVFGYWLVVVYVNSVVHGLDIVVYFCSCCFTCCYGCLL